MNTGKIYQIDVNDKTSAQALFDEESGAAAKFDKKPTNGKTPLPTTKRAFQMQQAMGIGGALGGGKSPALAAWLSSVIWGSGQIYADHWATGLSLIMLQVSLLAAGVLGYVHRIDILEFLKPYNIGEGSFLLAGIAGSLFASFIWIGNILHAYRITRPLHKRPFRGCESLWPIVCGAFWIPGVGQLMNAQTKKAFLFLLVPFLFYFSLFSTIWVSMIWTVLSDRENILVAEMVFIALAVSGVIYLICGAWAYYDAIQVNRHPGKRDNWLKRFRFAWTRWRREPLFDSLKSFTVSTLRHGIMIGLLAAAVWASWTFMPRSYYLRTLETISHASQEKGMTIVPELIGQAVKHLSALQNHLTNRHS